ncbi:MAG: hypothetical protein EOP58_01710 [Sphingomonadales bacterium]|nr:MAG: hypothetical protein EOP58_01710 [Sphingomonadales bacterium]
MRFLILLAPLLSGCAMTAAEISEGEVRETITSKRSAAEVAACTVDRMRGAADLRGAGGHWWVIRKNTFSVPMIRWDFKDQPGGGSVAEMRAPVSVNPGTDLVRFCS